MEYPKIYNLEKEIEFLSYQEKYTYLLILNDEEELNKIIDKLKNSNNFFLNLIDIESLDILKLIKLNHAFSYNKMGLNSDIKLKKKFFINSVIENFNDNYPNLSTET